MIRLKSQSSLKSKALYKIKYGYWMWMWDFAHYTCSNLKKITCVFMIIQGEQLEHTCIVKKFSVEKL